MRYGEKDPDYEAGEILSFSSCMFNLTLIFLKGFLHPAEVSLA